MARLCVDKRRDNGKQEWQRPDRTPPVTFSMFQHRRSVRTVELHNVAQPRRQLRGVSSMGWSYAVDSAAAGVRCRVPRHAARASLSIIRRTPWSSSLSYSTVIAAALSDSLTRVTPAGKTGDAPRRRIVSLPACGSINRSGACAGNTQSCSVHRVCTTKQGEGRSAPPKQRRHAMTEGEPASPS
jgi:hypothetical protein